MVMTSAEKQLSPSDTAA